MLTRATFRDDLPKERPPQGRVPTDRLPKYDGVELTFLLLGIGALTVLAVAG